MATIPQLAAATHRRRLDSALGDSSGDEASRCRLSWYGPGRPEPGAESTVQAACGLMEVHGWDFGGPRRLGIEVASVAAGILATCGTLATLIGARRRGTGVVGPASTSVLAGGLLLLAHHIAAATADGDLLPSPPGDAPGPPFATSDGRWFEIEVFEAESWIALWSKLGAGEANLGRAWTAFRSRYYRGRCTLPQELHAATRRATLAQVTEVAEAWGVSLVPLRDYDEVLNGPAWCEPRPTCRPGPTDPTGSTAGVSGAATPGPAASGPGGGGLPLEGITVVEATNRMQGPLAGLLLQLLGAQVTKVEPPGGDIGRMVPPECDGIGSFFQCYNRGKQSVEVNLSAPAGRQELLDLMAGADVFLHNWRPGRAEHWGLDQPAAAAANPALVYAEASGWGPDPALEGIIGTDFLVQAHAAFGTGLNPPGDTPRTSRALLTDCLGALVTCESILTGLHLREATGAQAVAVRPSLLAGAMAAQAHVLASRREEGERGGVALKPWGPLDVPLPTRDGTLVVIGGEDASAADQVARLCSVPGPEAIPGAVAAQPAGYWLSQLQQAQIPCAVVARDVGRLPDEALTAPFFSPLSATCRGPGSPWTFE